ncbi:MAG: histidinol-phosphate transaminase [Candidatus Nezhaarchaeales archaeon]
MSVEAYVNPHVKRLSRYEVQERRVQAVKVYKLDANENLVLDENWVRSLVREAVEKVDVRLYPPIYASKAVEAIAEFLGISRRNVIVDNGRDSIIDLIAKCFVGQGRALIVEPTFEMYRFYVEALGGLAESFYMNEGFTINVDELLERAEGAKVVFLASPNNPTGTQHPREVIEAVAEEFDGIVVVDEAYADFGDFSLWDLPLRYDNVIVLRSFSKVAGLAGLRIGYAVVSEKVYNFLSRLQSPYSVNSLAQEVLQLVLSRWDFVKKAIEEIKIERDFVIRELMVINGVKPYHSKANFVLFRVNAMSSKELAERLASMGIYVRERDLKPLLENCIRVTIGPRSVNRLFLNALRSLLKINR